MPSFKQFKLPDLGEGLTEGEILRWLVHPGDAVALNQPIVEVETAKAAVEVPSPYAGVVTELHHGEGETIDVGTPLITFDVDPGGAAAPATGEATPARAPLAHDMVPAAAQTAALGGDEPGGAPAPGGRTSVLVGYGPKSAPAARRPRKDVSSAPPAPSTKPTRMSAAAVGAAARAGAGGVAVLAKPPVRKLAKDLGVDLTAVLGTGPNETITRADVEAAAARLPSAAVAEPAGAAAADALAVGAAAESVGAEAEAVAAAAAPTGGERRIPIKGVRKAMGEAMVASAFTAPHVTEWVQVDVTGTVDTVERLRAMPDFGDVKVSPLLLVAKGLLLAVRRHPVINSTWDAAAGEIVVKDYVNLGIAAATPRGLVVPNVKNADRMALPELARALGALAQTAREGRTPPADMQGGTITITNVGVFGVDSGTPILNPGEAAILAVGAIRHLPWVVDGQVVPRWVTTLALSFDHRHIDGELGSRVLRDVADFLVDPTARLLAWA